MAGDGHLDRPAARHLADQPDPDGADPPAEDQRYRYQYTDELGPPGHLDQPIEQPPWFVRGLWFIFVGWWASAIAMSVGWVLIVLIITMPIGLMIYNRVPFVASLFRY